MAAPSAGVRSRHRGTGGETGDPEHLSDSSCCLSLPTLPACLLPSELARRNRPDAEDFSNSATESVKIREASLTDERLFHLVFYVYNFFSTRERIDPRRSFNECHLDLVAALFFYTQSCCCYADLFPFTRTTVRRGPLSILLLS